MIGHVFVSVVKSSVARFMRLRIVSRVHFHCGPAAFVSSARSASKGFERPGVDVAPPTATSHPADDQRVSGGTTPPVGTASTGVGQSAPAPLSRAAALDDETVAKLKAAESIGEEAFSENVEILKRLMLRGLRAVTIGVVGFVAFSIAMRRRARNQEQSEVTEDATERYLEEMRSLGFDVDGLEEEVEAERKMRLTNTAGHVGGKLGK